MGRWLSWCVVALALLSPCPWKTWADDEPKPKWREQLEAIQNRDEYRHAHWGLLVQDAETGDVIIESNADKLFAPASVTKLFTVAAAWEELGPDFRFITPVFRAGAVGEDGRLNGHLILVGSGDPTLGGRTTADGGIAFRNGDHTYANGNNEAQITDENPLAGLDALAKQVFESGIRHVAGDVLIDSRLFDPAASTGSGPEKVSPIVVNDNVVDFVITPKEEGEPASVTSRPESAVLEVDSHVETIAAGESPEVHARWVGAGRIIVRGKIPEGRAPLIRVLEWSDPELTARAFFIEALGRAGVAVDSSPLAPPNINQLPPPAWYITAPRVAALESPAFAQEAKLILKVSHNLHASTLPLILATRRGKRTLADGMKIEGEILESLGVDRSTISLGGGAGGDQADYVTRGAAVTLLRALARRDDFDRFREALPILGVDGTLAKVVPPDSPAKGKVSAKTGTLYWNNLLNDRILVSSKALAGYIDAASGRRLAFAVFVNLTHIDEATETAREGKALGAIAEALQQGL